MYSALSVLEQVAQSGYALAGFVPILGVRKRSCRAAGGMVNLEHHEGLGMRCGAATWLLRAAAEGRVNGESKRPPAILVVEDEAATRHLFATYLRRRGYDVLEAEHGQGALVMAQRNEPDVIVLDIKMPVLDGVTTAELLKLDATTAHIPLIAVTGYPFEGGQDEARQKGFEAYLAKPLAPDELAHTIDLLLQAQ